jgi:TRAP transporter 4TM/12TM fusion protein
LKRLIAGMALFTGFYHVLIVGGVFTALGIYVSPLSHRAISLALALILLFLLFPASKKEGQRGSIAWYDVVLILLGVVPLGFTTIFGDTMNNYNMIGTVDLKGLIFSFSLLVVLLEGARRASDSLILPGFLLLVFLIIMFGNYMPGVLHTMGFSPRELAFVLFVGPSGFFGIPLRVASTIIIMFVVFSQVLLEIGGSDWFIKLALSIVGTMKGGAAKAAVLASALFGTISGSPSSNAAAIGTITIPLMNKAGYSPDFAAGVEATASTGGQIMPPVMGAVAFVIAEWLEIRYIDVCLAAAVPAILYFAVLFYGVDIEARKRNLKGVTAMEVQPFITVIKSGWYYILPLAVLIYFLIFLSFPAEMAAFLSILAIFVLSIFINRETKKLALPSSLRETGIRLEKVVLSIGSGVKMWVRIAVICAAVGILIGCLTQSGIALKIASSIIQFSGGNLILVLLLTAVAAYILGMGMDTLPLYIALAVLVAPALIKMGVAPIGAHLFVLFWGLTSFITPPVCLAVYVTSSIAGTGIWKTGFEAMRLGIVLFFIPFAFVYLPNLILPAPIDGFLFAFIKTVFGCIGMVGGLTGFLVKNSNWILRILLFAGGVMTLFPIWQVFASGIALIVAIGVWQWLTRKEKVSRPPESQTTN